jgi:hypothetical protein
MTLTAFLLQLVHNLTSTDVLKTNSDFKILRTECFVRAVSGNLTRRALPVKTCESGCLNAAANKSRREKCLI